MAKKKSWFSLVKRFFLFETIAKTDKKEKRRKWIFGRLRTKQLTAPPCNDHALTAVIPTAESALPDAAEVVPICDEQTMDVQFDSSSSNEHKRKIQELSATKIQATFRGYLARKALRALKGIVKLQAIIRGTAVRRQAMNTLKCLESIVNIQSQVCAKRFHRAEVTWQYDETKQLVTLDEWMDTQVTKSKELEDLDSIWTPIRNPPVEIRAKQLRLKTFPRQYQYHLEGLGSPVVSPVPRRSYHKKQPSLREPTYMAATQSAKAKVRSMSSPKVRPAGSFDTQSESYSPYKNKMCIVSSVTRNSGYQQQRSPSLKGVPGPVKSNRTLRLCLVGRKIGMNERKKGRLDGKWMIWLFSRREKEKERKYEVK